jgi:gliding motility-associated-like protein
MHVSNEGDRRKTRPGSEQLVFPRFMRLSFLLILYAGSVNAQWTVTNPFEPKEFVENRGRYPADASGQEILYSAAQDGLQYFFTRTGLRIVHLKKVKRTEQEMKARRKNFGKKEEDKLQEEEEEALTWKQVEEVHQLFFSGAESSVQIIAEEQTPTLYISGAENNTTLQAHSYRKLIYSNLYPGIDMAFQFPKDKPGFKYNFIVHPGADPTRIKLTYPPHELIRSGPNGDVIITSEYGDFTDHAPEATELTSGKSIACSFIPVKDGITFHTGSYDPTKGLNIDPWTVTPSFSGYNKAFDVDWDLAGNCYAYGGYPPFTLIKFNSAGVPLYNYTTTVFTNGGGGTNYGDFAVDRNSGSVYIIDGFNYYFGSKVVKLNASGFQAALFAGVPNFNEMWRISFSPCTHSAVIAGGGTTFPSNTGCYLDTNLVNLTPINITGAPDGYHDVWGLTLDNSGSAYFLTSTSSSTVGANTTYDNQIYKVPVPTLFPNDWQVPEGYAIQEVRSVKYNYLSDVMNGFNSTTSSNNHLYTYDSYVLKKWNTATGALLSSANINGLSQAGVYWSGMGADDCDHIFVGSKRQVMEYDGTTMSLITSLTQADTVYDVMLAKNGLLYTCGRGFVSASMLNIPSCFSPFQFNNVIINQGCTTPVGSATVVITGGSNPFNISWNTVPSQNGNTITNLSPGTYIAALGNTSCSSQAVYDTVVITRTGGFTATISEKSVSCIIENSGSAQANVSSTAIAPYSYTWTPGPESGQGTALASGLSPITYTCLIHDAAGCLNQQTVTIYDPYANLGLRATTHLTNVFTPNGDNDNDVFGPFSSIHSTQAVSFPDTYDLKVYDRWGVLLFQNIPGITEYWDGKTLKGKDAKEGTYYWIATFQTNCPGDENIQTIKGFVQLIR